MGTRGIAVDYYGGPTIDPTENVKDLSRALSARQDDLREINNQYLLQRIIAVEDVARIRAEHARELNDLEANRRDNIRQVDIQNAMRGEERAGEAIKTLAVQTASIAETSRTAAANSASQIATQLTSLFAESNKRISALELSLSEGKGKATVEDPRIQRISELVENLSFGRQNDSGKAAGVDSTWKMIIAAVGLLVALNTLGMLDKFKTPSIPVFAPAPIGTIVPGR